MLLLVALTVNMNGAETKFPDVAKLPARAELPDPLVMLDGTPVTSARQWTRQRRPELKSLFQHYMYGELPPKPDKLDFKSEVVDEKFLNGAATLKLDRKSVV